MKNPIRYLMLSAVASAGFLLLLDPQPPASAQNAGSNVGLANRWNYLTNATAAVCTNTTANTFSYAGTSFNATTPTSLSIPLYRGRGMCFFASLIGSNAISSAVTYKFDFSFDGTNWTTTSPIQFSVALNGTNNVVAYTNILADQFDNARYARITSLTFAGATSNATNNWLAWSAIP